MGVSVNGGTPKSSILIGFSIINHPFRGTPIFGNTLITDGNSHRLCRPEVAALRGPCSAHRFQICTDHTAWRMASGDHLQQRFCMWIFENLMADLFVFSCKTCAQAASFILERSWKHLETHSAVAPGLQLCPKKLQDNRKEKNSDILPSGFLSKWTILEVLSIKRTVFWKEILGGGNSNIFYFHPKPWGNSLQFDSYVSDGFPTDSPHCQAAVRVEPPSYPGWEIAEPEWGFDRVRGFDTCVFFETLPNSML